MFGKTTLLVRNLTNAVALDFDWENRCIYWSDVTKSISSISRMCMNNSIFIDDNNNNYDIEVLHHTHVKNPDGLAVDWVCSTFNFFKNFIKFIVIVIKKPEQLFQKK